MDLTLFVFFVLPIATIILSIVLLKVLKSPILVALTFFAIYLIVAFTTFSDNLATALIVVIILTIISYITAYIVMLIFSCRRRFCSNNSSVGNNNRFDNQIQNRIITTKNNYGSENYEINTNEVRKQVNEETKNMIGEIPTIDKYGNTIMNMNPMRRCYRR